MFLCLGLLGGRAWADDAAPAPTPAPVDGTIYNIPSGSWVNEPDGTHFVTSATLWLLTRDELDGVILQSADNKRLEAALADCQKRADGTPPKPTFWQSTYGHRILGTAAVVAIVAAGYGGFRVGVQIHR